MGSTCVSRSVGVLTLGLLVDPRTPPLLALSLLRCKVQGAKCKGFQEDGLPMMLIDFLEEQQWSKVQVITRRKERGKLFVWIVKACLPPKEQEASGERSQVWQYVDSDDSGLHIYVTRTAHRQPETQERSCSLRVRMTSIR